MTATAVVHDQLLEWAVAGCMLAGEQVSGDLHLVRPFEGGALVAVIDGLGHGPGAADAARVAAEALSRRPEASVLDLMQLSHEALRPTRGAVISLASFDGRRGVMTWVGVGDVQGVLESAAGPRQGILLRNGVVGYQIPGLRAVEVTVMPGDTLIFATDGLRGEFTATVAGGRPAQEIADDILLRHGKRTDDALVLVARYQGLAP